MAHDWKNDPLKPGVRVTFQRGGKTIAGEVRLMSHDAKQAMVAFDDGSGKREEPIKREQLQLAE